MTGPGKIRSSQLRTALLEVQRWETERAWCDSDDLDNAEERLEAAVRALADLLCGDKDGTLPTLPSTL